MRQGAERRLDKGRDCTSEFRQLACFSSTPTAWARTYLGDLTGSVFSGLEPAFERGGVYYLQSLSTGRRYEVCSKTNWNV